MSLTEGRFEIRIPSDGLELNFVRTEERNQGREQHWEAIRDTVAGRDHRFQVWTYDGGKTWGGQMQARKPTHPGPVVATREQPTMTAAIDALREAYREYCRERYGERRQ